MKKILFSISLVALLFTSQSSNAQTTINLADQCNCEVIKHNAEINAGDVAPAGTDVGDLLIDPSGDLFFWDGDSWESPTAAQKAQPWFDAATNMEATSNTQNIYQMGNVGIGTTNPTDKLEVAGRITTLNNLEIGQLGSGDRASFIDLHATDSGDFESRMYRFAGENGLLLFENKGTGDIRFDVKESGNTADFTIDGATANIGIGISAPVTDLHIVDTLPILRIGTTGGTRGAIEFGNAAHGVKRDFNAAQNDVGVYTTGGDLHLSTNGEATGEFTLTNTGNVGIGTDAPSTKLDVNGNARVRTLPAGAAADGIVTTDADGNLRQRTAAEIVAEGGGGGGADGDAWAVTGEDQASAISRTGNVGIGTTNPTEKLEVAGRIATLNNLEIGQLGSGDRPSFIDLHATDSGDFESRVYRFAGENGLLFFENKGTGDIRFDVKESGSTTDFVIDGPTANIGIGTSAPFTDLHIVDTLPILRIGTTGGTRGEIQLGNSFHGLKRDFTGNINDVGLHTDFGDLHLSADGEKTGELTLTGTGNVGIGTDAPTTDLHIVDTLPILRIGTTGGTRGAIEFGNAAHGVKRDFNDAQNDVGVYTTGGDVHLSTDGEATGEFTLTNTGNVGIGTDAPSTKLDVNGNVRVRTLPAGAAADGIVTADADGNLRQRTAAEIVAEGGGGADGDAWAVTGEDQTSAISRTGNVGIGTTNPTEKLEVAGRIATLNNLEIGQLGSGDRPSFIDLHATDSGDFESRVYRFAGENGLLFFENKGTGDIRFDVKESGSTTDFVIDGATANIGIGTSAPFTDLHIVDTLPILRIGTTGGTRGAIEFGNGLHGLKRDFAGDVNDVGLYTDFGDIHLSADGEKTGELTLTGTGNVGIGTDAPEKKLQVMGETVIGTPTSTLPIANFFTDLEVTDVDNDNVAMIRAVGQFASVSVNSEDYDRRIDARTTTTGAIVSTFTEGGGSTGMTTTTSSSDPGGQLILSAANSVFNNQNSIIVKAGNSQNYIESTLGTGTGYIYFNNSNVGIGDIPTPTEKLHVDGNILATGTITPDYVFQKYFDGESTLKPEYKMMSLSEIESFTKINKHLPGVPSAQEVAAKGGIMVNRSTELNLEKIEELFLHTIEQEKKIQELEAQLTELETLKVEMAKIKALLSGKE